MKAAQVLSISSEHPSPARDDAAGGGTEYDLLRRKLAGSPRRGVSAIDTRLKLLMMAAFIAAALTCTTALAQACFFVLAALLLALCGALRKVLLYAAVYTVALAAGHLLALWPESIPAAAAGILVHAIPRFLPLVMVGAWFVGATSVSDWIAAMQKLRLPGAITLPLAVLLRFMPTVGAEASQIRDAMRLRGLDGGVWGFFRHPVRSAEHILVPLMMRSIRVADELSAAALTRGYVPGAKRSALRTSRIRMPDITITLMVCAASFGLVALDKIVLAPGGLL